MSQKHPYQQVKAAVLAKIRAGEWRPGDAIPGDAELAEQFSCARMTAHRAMRELAEEGVIERRRRRGSRVALRSGRTALFDIPRIDLEIEATGAPYSYTRLQRSIRPASVKARNELGLERGTKALWLLCLHGAGKVPFQLEERWIHLEAAPQAQQESFRDVGPNRWLLEHVPWSNAEHTISSELARGRAAKLLEVDVGSPLLVVERRTRFEDLAVTYVKMSHPGSFYRLRAAASAPSIEGAGSY